ncbi:WD40/YVTN/BNR-like repeat-containing protein [Chitinimonas koreensis]|uniref:WD40/YVTN/BNR-like repeat-containing protein n=1 Tax=Chitinimonas koreensis TaxID=356302 RepID=UPI0004045F1C|nr:sialidase family protein [Chitinimonas koreensis]QNM96122.1 exo-alpha-sialidase [Chitinimonas koreensis]
MSDTLLVGSRKGLLVYRRAADGWSLAGHHFAGVQVSMLLADGPRWYAALRNGHFGPKLHVSEDGGASWSERAAPAFPAELDGKPVVDQVWSLAAAPDGTLWAGCIPAGLFRSADGGRSWSLVESLWNRPERAKWFGGGFDDAGIHSILLDPRDPDRIVLGISCGGVWRSHDGGKNWETRCGGMWAAYMPPDAKEDPDIQDPHRLVQCREAPDIFWCQHHNGQFVSRDGLERWNEIWPAPPLSNFGFAVAAHPRDPGTAWFVPAEVDERRIPHEGDFYVLRTRDGGQGFDKLKAGLPPAPAFHLVYRHGLAVDGTGDGLAMASTTGSLWTSDDGGDNWQRVSAELPPVYCLAFST